MLQCISVINEQVVKDIFNVAHKIPSERMESNYASWIEQTLSHLTYTTHHLVSCSKHCRRKSKDAHWSLSHQTLLLRTNIWATLYWSWLRLLFKKNPTFPLISANCCYCWCSIKHVHVLNPVLVLQCYNLERKLGVNVVNLDNNQKGLNAEVWQYVAGILMPTASGASCPYWVGTP